MKIRQGVWFLLVVLVLAGFLVACSSDGSDDEEKDENPWIETDDDDNQQSDDDTPDAPSDSIKIESAWAPDQWTVKVQFTRNIGDLALEKDGYWIAGGSDNPYIKTVSYNSDSHIATLTTVYPQKLGFTYEVRFSTDGHSRTAETFLAADTYTFYSTDYESDSFGQYTLVANRVGVSDHAVIYVEQGYSVNDTDQTLTKWESKIWPTLTQMMCEPTDIDENGRVVVLGLDGGNYYGGYFNPINQLPDSQTMDWWGIHSNEMELVFINVNNESLGWAGTLPHEFQHLLWHTAHDDYYWSGGTYWAYHNEGLAECAVKAVYGNNDEAIETYLMDYNSDISQGISMVDWENLNPSQYSLAFMFWTYLASQVTGTSLYSEIFNMESGSPEETTAFIQYLMGAGEDFGTIQLKQMIANWVQADSGPYGYGSMLSFDPAAAPTVTAGTQSLNLKPYGGTYFKVSPSQVDYPGTQGDNIVYAGIDSAMNIDFDAPFDVNGGVLVVLNANPTQISFPAEHSGPDLGAVKFGSKIVPASWYENVPDTYFDPPPVGPMRKDLLYKWRDALHERLADGWTLRGGE